MTMPEKPQDTIKRTMYNLRFIEEHRSELGPFEVTQLVNSFLGALAHPWEDLQKELNALSLEEAKRMNWPEIRKLRPSDRDPKSLGELIEWTRHAFAHGNVKYYPDEKGRDIDSIRFWNNSRSGRRIWEVELGVRELRAYLNAFVTLANEIYEGKSESETQATED